MRKLFCKHDWKILSEQQTKSRIERYNKVASHVPIPQCSYDLRVMTECKFIQIVACSKCGKLKRFVENI